MVVNINSVKELQELLNGLPGMVFCCSCDKDLTFKYVSEGVRDLLGYSPSDLVHISAFRKLVHHDDQLRNKKILKKVNLANPRYEMVYRMRTPHGKDKWVKEQGQAIFSEKGELTIIHGILTDVTDEKIAEMELKNENRLLKATQKDRYRLGKLIGKSAIMQRVYDMILKAAASKDANILITGASGTGKELAARAIHDLSERSRNTFVAVNCGAISENLFESEFFGYIKGAFTGAMSDKKGYLDAADGGTLFLDEVGEIPHSLQVKLLRVLEDKSFMPVGSNISKKSDFRVVAATNQDLNKIVKKGGMRMDFFFRINVITINMPTLLERREDILFLVGYFLENYELRTGKEMSSYDFLSKMLQEDCNFLSKMQQHGWPGNVRELKNVVERFITMGEFSFFEELELVDNSNGRKRDDSIASRLSPMQLDEAINDHERNLILQTLHECKWKKGLCAERLGISWRTLQRKLKKYEIE